MHAPASAFTPLFWAAPDGAKLRYAWFDAPAPSRGTVLCLHGRRECIEIYLEQIADWNARGFDVITFDWRGQGGSDRPLPDRHKHHIESFDMYRDDLQQFYTAIVKPRVKNALLVFGHSMGGFIALDWLITNKPDVVCAVLPAPMLALPTPSWTYNALLGVCQVAIKLGHGDSYIPNEGRFDASHWIFMGNPLTHDTVRFRLIPDCFAAHPELALGGTTYVWLRAALKAIHRVREHLPMVQPPVLILNSGEDHVVMSSELSYWSRYIPQVTEKIYPHAKHDIMLETDDLRAAAWKDIDAFIATLIK